ncbi:MAG TPA: phospholipid carrier-dependent glycosyltransferase [Phycisphaerales bacterium]|nr:phospholipid carrier-dependent glycosyltransferase [Phycisphaerales bacterium]HMP35907.1 phospholipid carrier-dependent glycosyltransferase [Phycisphaerales bacterium]
MSSAVLPPALLAAAATFIVALAMLLPGLNASPLARTEPHRAVPAHEMVTTGDWAVPRLYGVPYVRKPPLHYWSLAATEVLSGSTEPWAYRLPSVLSGALLAAVVALAAGAWFGAPAAIVGGLACLAIVPLWAQQRSADVDALNTLFSIVAALLLLEIGRRLQSPRQERKDDGAPASRSLALAVAAAAALGAALLVKGPAALTIVGAAAAGAIWLAEGARRRAAGWVGAILVGGTALLAAWTFVALRRLAAAGEAFDWSGVAEAADRAGGVSSVAYRAVVPIIALLLALPLSATLAASIDRRYLPCRDRAALRMAMAVALSVLVALLIGIPGGVDNPRYAYIVLPPLALLAAAVATAHGRGELGEPQRRRVRQAGTIAAIGLAAGIVALVAVNASRGSAGALSWIALAGSIVVAPVAVLLWVRRDSGAAALATFGLVFLLAWAFTDQRNGVRRVVASVDAAAELRALVGDDGPVRSGLWVMTGPELFWYAKIPVEYVAEGLDASTLPASGRWAVFHREEWERLDDRDRERFDRVVELGVRSRNAIAALRGRG